MEINDTTDFEYPLHWEQLVNLFESLDTDNEAAIENISESLVKLGEEVLPALISIFSSYVLGDELNSEERKYFSRIVVLTLRKLGSPSVSYLSNMLTKGDPLFSMPAGTLLGELGDSSVCPLLADTVQTAEVIRPVAVVAAKALSKLGETGFSWLIRLSQNENPKIRWYATHGLAELNTKAASTILINLLDDESIQVKQTAAFGLGKEGNDEAILPLTKLLTLDDKQLLIYIFYSLGTIGNEKAIRFIKPFQNHNDTQVRKTVRGALTQLYVRQQGENMLPFVLKKLKSNKSETRAWAIYALSYQIQIKNILSLREFLLPLLKDSDWLVRLEVVDVLAGSWNHDFTLILPALKDSNEHVRARAVSVIGSRGLNKAVPYITEMLSDNAPEVRDAATRSLSSIKAIQG